MRQKTDVELAGELEEIATDAAERVHAVIDGDVHREADLQRKVGEGAGRAIAAGRSLAAIAEAERIGQRRVREELGPEVLRRVERTARRKHETEREYEHAVVCACRLGLAHRDVAAAAQVAHGTVRAIVALMQTVSAQHAESTTPAVGDVSEQQPAGAGQLVDAVPERT